jgi:hypothetical protein
VQSNWVHYGVAALLCVLPSHGPLSCRPPRRAMYEGCEGCIEGFVKGTEAAGGPVGAMR